MYVVCSPHLIKMDQQQRSQGKAAKMIKGLEAFSGNRLKRS